jgi:hypothetical protein
MATCRAASGMSVADFDLAYASIVGRVDALFTKDLHDIVFNGKWYAAFLAADADVAASGRPYQRGDIRERLTATLRATLDFSANWASRLHAAVDAVAALV